MAILWTKFVIKLFLGRIDANEVQVIYQRGWVFLCNIILFWGTSSTRIDDNPYNIAVYILSLFVLLVLHWICAKRVSNMTSIVLATDFRFFFNQARFACISLILFVVDIGLIMTAIQRFKEQDYTFATFSFVLMDLMEMSSVLIFQYALNMYSAYYLYINEDEDDWEKLKLFTAALKFSAACIASVAHLQVGYGLGSSMNTYGSLVFRISRLYSYGADFLRALRAKHELDEFTSLATAEDLSRDNTCVICRDEMDVKDSSSAKLSSRKLRCGHIMHAKCLVSWMSQSPSCPTCRQPVKSATSSFRSSNSTEIPHDSAQTDDGRNTSVTGPTDARTTALDRTTTAPLVASGASQTNAQATMSEQTSVEAVSSLSHSSSAYILPLNNDAQTRQMKYSIPIAMHDQHWGVLADRYDVRINYDEFYNA